VDIMDPRVAIRAYARRLCEVLQHHIGVITQTAEPMSRAVYQTATLQLNDPQKHTDWQLRGSSPKPPAPPISEQNLLLEWRAKAYQEPLLIVAPPGSGKSCLLESFALQMARDLLDDEAWPESQRLPIAVPLLISLAKMLDSPLNDYLLLAEHDLTESPAIPPRLLTELQKEGRLVLLFDGFDEIPSAHGHLVKQLKKWNAGFAVTSRPGHGERRVVPNQLRHRTLQELTADQARAYVRAYFTERQSVGIATEDIVEMFDRACRTHLGRLLRRPLYLKSWCDYVEEENGRRVPVGLAHLSHLMLLRSLEARKQFDSLPPADLHAAVTGFIDWFGRLGLRFAAGDFEGELTRTLVQDGAIGNDVDKFTIDGKEFSFESVAKRCGLLMYSKQGDKYRIAKVPLVEYVIGKYLADDAMQHPFGPQILIEKFQHWIWRPERHEILDHMFEAIWSSERGDVSRWGNELLAWAKGVGLQDATRPDQADVRTQDDLIHPFATAVLRWRLLDAKTGSTELHSEVQDVVQAAFTLLKNDWFVGELLGDFLDNEQLFDLFIETFTAQQENAKNDRRAQGVWLKAIESAASRVSEAAAPNFVTRFIAEHERTKDDPQAQANWLWAISRAAGRVRETDAAKLVSQWFERYEKAKDPGVQEAWGRAIDGAASRVSEAAAPNFVARFIAEHERAKDDPQARAKWLWAISRAAGRVRETDATKLVSKWFARYENAKDPNVQEAWGRAIDGAASRVSKAAAAKVVSQWILAYANAKDDPDAQAVWLKAIAIAAGRVSDAAAPNLVMRLIAEHGKAQDHPKAQEAWESAIENAAIAVSESAAATVVSQWISEHAKAEGSPKAQVAWGRAIEYAASKVSESAASKLVTRLLAEHRKAKGDPKAQEAWARAIVRTSRRVSESAVVRLVRRLLAEHRKSKGDRKAQEMWQEAIQNAALQVSEAGARNLMTLLIEEHGKARDDPAVQEAWLWTIPFAAGRVSEAAAPNLVTQLIAERRKAHPDAQNAWQYALELVAGRVSEAAASKLLPRWIAEHAKATADPDAQKVWQGIICTAADRVRENDLPFKAESAVISACNFLVANDMQSYAFRVVANNPSFAIVSTRVADPYPADAVERRSVSYAAVLRKDQILDKDLVVAPPLVRAAFIEKGLSALEHSLSDSSLASGMPGTIVQPVDVEGIRSDIDGLKQFAEVGTRCRDFERRLADITARVEGRPAIGRIVRDELEHFDLSASGIPADASLTIPKEDREREKFLKHLRIFYEIGKLQLEPTKPTYEQIAAILTKRRGKDYPKDYPYTKSPVQRWCTERLPAFFQRVFELDSNPQLFEKFGANNSNCGLSVTGKHIWKLTIDCLGSERLSSN
jgi:hypothetical protein